MSSTHEVRDEPQYYVNESGVLIQVSRGPSGGEHLKFIYDVPGLQAAPRRLHTQSRHQELPQAGASLTTDHRVAVHNGREDAHGDTSPRFATPAPQTKRDPGSALNTPRRPPPLQASPRMERQTPVVDRVLRGDGPSNLNIVPFSRERMEQEAEMTRQQVAREREMQERVIFYQQKAKMEKRRDEARLAMEYDTLGIVARETSDVHTRHLTPSEDSQSAYLRSSSPSDGSFVRVEHPRERASRSSLPSREELFPQMSREIYYRDDSIYEEFARTPVDDRSRATTPACRGSNTCEGERTMSYEPFVVVNRLQAALPTDNSTSLTSLSTLSMSELSEIFHHSSAGNTPGPEHGRLPRSPVSGPSRRRGDRVFNNDVPTHVKQEVVEPTILTRSRAKAKARND